MREVNALAVLVELGDAGRRPGPRLTVNAGLRYDLQRLPSLVHTDGDNVSPRLGAVWDLRGDGRRVLRAAAGLYYEVRDVMGRRMHPAVVLDFRIETNLSRDVRIRL
jgi:hypothetical protein